MDYFAQYYNSDRHNYEINTSLTQRWNSCTWHVQFENEIFFSLPLQDLSNTRQGRSYGFVNCQPEDL